jgi:hypothetical protein
MIGHILAKRKFMLKKQTDLYPKYNGFALRRNCFRRPLSAKFRPMYAPFQTWA